MTFEYFEDRRGGASQTSIVSKYWQCNHCGKRGPQFRGTAEPPPTWLWGELDLGQPTAAWAGGTTINLAICEDCRPEFATWCRYESD